MYNMTLYTYIARLLSASCNTEHGIANVKYAVYHAQNEEIVAFEANAVSDSLCQKGDYNKESRIVGMTTDSLAGVKKILHKVI